MPTTVNYTVTRGLPWERQICVKSRQTRWRMSVTDVNAFVNYGNGYKKEIYSEVMGNNNILLSMSDEETLDLPEGDLAYDVWANVRTAVDRTPVYQPVAKGRLRVGTYATVTPREDAEAMELRHVENTDQVVVISWKDEGDVLLSVSNARLVAANSAGTAVLDLRWYYPAPSEATINALPGIQRGYLSRSTGASIEIHISQSNPIAAGTYTYDLVVQDSLGNWEQLMRGSLVVEAAVTNIMEIL